MRRCSGVELWWYQVHHRRDGALDYIDSWQEYILPLCEATSSPEVIKDETGAVYVELRR